MGSDLRIYVDGGNRLTKVMEELKKPFSFPTIVSPAEVDLNYGLNFDQWEMENELENVSIETMLVEIIKDGESLGKKLVGQAAENKGLLIRDRNRYERKAGDSVIVFSTLAGIAYNLYKSNKDDLNLDITLNQPLIEYAIDRKSSISKYNNNLKGNFKVLFYNVYNINQIIAETNFEIGRISFCPEAIATYYSYAIDEYGRVKGEYKDNKKSIVWDIGSGQINVTAFDGMKVVGVNTFEKGMMDCYEKISMMVYNNYRDKLDRKPFTYEIDNMIRFGNGIIKAKKGINIDTKEIVRNVFDNFAYELNKDIREFAKSKFFSNSNNIILCGGGSTILFSDLDKYLNNDFNCLKSNMGEFDNVIGSMYYRMYKDNTEKNEE
ncbi:hypothetical protein [Wukongibacter sp. M2B1]|uniref:hypothetical protein n=1 Tax=Wukongibacter sp. M2B1 TaxID=3088895 RepID=UPI003D797AD4